MTVTAQILSEQYAGNGVTDTFAYRFKIFDKSELVVREIVTATGALTLLAEGTDYTVTGVGEDAGGTVVLDTPTASGVTLDLRPVYAVTQPASFKNQGKFLPESHESAFDRRTLADQMMRRLLARCVQLPDQWEPGGDPAWSSILSLDNRKGKYFGFSATTGAPELFTSIGAQVLSQSIIAGFLHPQTSLEATLGVSPSSLVYLPGDPLRASFYENLGWTDFGDVPTHLSASSFSVPGDQSARYLTKMRVCLIGSAGRVYGRILTVVVTAVTTITVSLDSGSVPNPVHAVWLQLLPMANRGSTCVIDLAGGPYALIVGNNSLNAAAQGRLIVGCGETGTGAFDSAIAIAATPNAAGAYLPGGPTGRCITLHTGTATPIVIGTNDVPRITLPGDGTAIVVTSDVYLNKNALTNNLGQFIANGLTSGKFRLEANQTQVGYLYGDVTEVIVGSETAIPFSFISGGTRRMTIAGTGLGNFANDAAAGAGGVPVGTLYRNGSVIQIRVT